MFLTLTYPPNIYIWLGLQFWYPRVGSFIPFIDADFWYYALFTYILDQHWLRPYSTVCIWAHTYQDFYVSLCTLRVLTMFDLDCRRTQTHRKMIGCSCVGHWTAKNSHKTYALTRSRTSWCRFGWLCKQCSCNSCKHAPCSPRTSNRSPIRFKQTRSLATVVAGRCPTPRRPCAWALQANRAAYSTRSIRPRKTRSCRTSTSRPAGPTSCGATNPLFWWSEMSSTATPCCCRRRRLRLTRASPR